MVLVKGTRKNYKWMDGMPLGTENAMTSKDIMISKPFIQWLKQFANSNIKGHDLLIFDSAASQLDISILEAGIYLGITLRCLPNNTTYTLQL